MKRLKQFENLVIEDLEVDEFHRPPHHQNYFEIAFIVEGKGKAIINTKEIEYHRPDVFLLAPDDVHYFKIETKTQFVFIKFNEHYFINEGVKLEHSTMSRLLGLFSTSYLKEVPPVWSSSEKDFFSTIIVQILQLWNVGNNQTSYAIYYLIASVLGKIADHLKQENPTTEKQERQTSLLLHYIHQNIYFPEKIRVKNVAAHFHISENYFSEWFRKNFDCTYREYTDRYRTSLISSRILLKTFTLQQIADEFGFSDSSHLSRYFLQQTGYRPKNFIKNKCTDLEP